MLCPTSTARSTPNASSNAVSQSAIDPIDVLALPPLLPCAGKSMASALLPWWAKYRACNPQTLWSFAAPCTNTIVGRARSNARAPVYT